MDHTMEDFDAWLRRTVDNDDPARRFQADEAQWLAAKALLEAAAQRRQRAAAWRFAVLAGALLLLSGTVWVTVYRVKSTDQPAGIAAAHRSTTPDGQQPDVSACNLPVPTMRESAAAPPHLAAAGDQRNAAVQANRAAVGRATIPPLPDLMPTPTSADSIQSADGTPATEPQGRMEALSPLALRSSTPVNKPDLSVPVRIAPPPATPMRYRGLTGSIGPEGFAIGILHRRQYGRWSVQTTLQWRNQQRLRIASTKSVATLRYGFGFEETIQTARPVSAQNIEGLIGLSRQWRHHELEVGFMAGNRLRIAAVRETMRRTSLMPELSPVGQSVGRLPGTNLQRWYTGFYAGYQYRFGHRWSVGAQLFYLPGGFWNAPNTSAASQPWQGMLGLRRYF